jgi:hypothetical protein
MVALAFVALAAPAAFAQAPAPKVTISGLIDNLTTYSSNVSNADGILNRKDDQWYARTRGRLDFIGEVGKAKAVFGIELDHVYGQAGSNDSTINNAGAASGTAVATQFGTDGSFDLNTDSRGIIEIKWLYVEFPVPLIPVPTTARLGAQPFGAASSFKTCVYTCSDFAGVNITSQVSPNVKVLLTYIQVEENLVGTGTRSGSFCDGGNCPGPVGYTGATANTQNRGDDFSYILSAQVTPFKGLDLQPLFSMFYASGTTSGNSRQGRGGIGTSTEFTGTGAASRGGINEYRHTVGLDARYRMGPLSIDPSVLYQWGQRAVIASSSFTDAGAIAGRKYHADINAWLVDVREGYQLGPLLLEALQVWSTGNKSRNTTLDTVSYFQPLDLDTSYLGDWGPQLTALGLDYLNAMDEAGARVAYPGDAIGWDKYGRIQLGVKATYAITPALSAMVGVNWHWTAEAVDKNSTAVSGAGLLPVFNNPGNKENNSRYVGTELMALLSWKFADNLVWDNAFGYMFAGQVLSTITDATLAPRNAKDPYILTSRVRFTF